MNGSTRNSILHKYTSSSTDPMRDLQLYKDCQVYKIHASWASSCQLSVYEEGHQGKQENHSAPRKIPMSS